MHPLLGFDFGSFPIYQIMLFIALLTGYISYKKAFKKKFYSKFIYKRIKSSVNGAAVCGLLGSNLVCWVIYEGVTNYSIFNRLTQGGYSFYFGVLTFFASLALFFRLSGIDFKFGLNKVVPSILIAQFVARLGCCLKGCCWGIPISLFGIEFLAPVRELEAIFALVMFIVLSKSKRAFQNRLGIYLFSYSLFRFFTEFLRGDDRGTLFGITFLTPTQIVSALVIIASGAMLFTRLILKAVEKEQLLDDFNAKIKGFIETIRQKVFRKKSPYTPYPINYPGPEGKKKPIKIVLTITSIILVIALLFMYINPFSSGFRDWINESLFQDKGTENEIAEANGINLVDVSGKEKITKKSEAVALVKECDNWNDFDYKVISDKKLPNGSNLYVCAQVVKDKPVIGKNRVIVTDENDDPLYVAGDTSTLTFTDDISDTFINNNKTIEDTFGDKAIIIEKMECWYDTHQGLVEAYHAILSEDGKTPLIGVVVQKDNDRIICVTRPVLGVLSDKISSTINSSTELVSKYINGGNENKIEEMEEIKKSEISDAEKISRVFEKILCSIYKKCILAEEWFGEVLETVNIISENVSGIGLDMFREILIEETSRTLLGRNESENEVSKTLKEIRKIFRKNDIKQETDEAVVSLNAEIGKVSFEYEINFISDIDTFSLTTSPNSTTEISVNPDTPVYVEIYTKRGNLVTTMYMEDKETITLYPEDGSEFVMRVSDAFNEIGKISLKSKYGISMKSADFEKEVPKNITNTISLIEESYNNSLAAGFYSIYAIGGEKMAFQDAIGTSILSLMVDSCVSDCSGVSYAADSAKTMIASEIVREHEAYAEEFTFLKGSELELTYISHIETEEYVVLKLHTRIELNGLDIYNGYTFMRLEHIEESQVELSEEEQQISDLFNFLIGETYYITAINSNELYEMFGDSPSDISPTSDLTSLYDLWVPAEEKVGNITLSVMTFDKDEAAKKGHSLEKVEEFESYTARYNLLTIKQYQKSLEMQLAVFNGIDEYGEPAKTLYDFSTDFDAATADFIFGQNETTEALWLSAKFLVDPTGTVTDLLIGEVINASGGIATNIQKELDEVNKVVQKYESKL